MYLCKLIYILKTSIFAQTYWKVESNKKQFLKEICDIYFYRQHKNKWN